jgi:cobalamin biosynthesis protein CobT
MSSSLTKWISETTVDLQKKADYIVYTTDFDKIEPLKVPKDFDMAHVERLEDTVNHMVGPIQKDLERAIVAHSRSFWQPGRRSGRLHGANLSRLRFNDDRVFRSREEHTCKDTAIELVIDCSGSMNGRGKIEVATQAAYALSMTLDRMQIAHEVIGFTTYYNSSKEYEKVYRNMYDELRKLGRHCYSRQDCIVMPIVKDFNERITTEHKRRFAAMPHMRRGSQMFGNNIDGECIEIAARRLAKRSEARKVMIVLSDGAPAGQGNNHEIQCHTKRVIESIEKSSGMEIVGIGIASNAVKQFYTRNVVLNDIESLPAVVMNELKHALLHA